VFYPGGSRPENTREIQNIFLKTITAVASFQPQWTSYGRALSLDKILPKKLFHTAVKRSISALFGLCFRPPYLDVCS